MKIRLTILSLFLALLSTNVKSQCIEHWLLVGQSNAGNVYYLGGLRHKLTVNGCKIKTWAAFKYGSPIDGIDGDTETYTRTISLLKANHIKIDRIIYSQGEADSYFYTTAITWVSKVSILLGNYIASVGRNNNIPIIMVQLNNLDHSVEVFNADGSKLRDVRRYWGYIRLMQGRMRSEQITVIDSSNYVFLPDNVHMYPEQYELLAEDIVKKGTVKRVTVKK
jgi:hypothetical protein